MRKLVTIILAIVSLTPLIHAQGYPDHSVLASGNWYKIGISNTGIHRLGINEMPALEWLSTSSIALYGQKGGTLPKENWKNRYNDLDPIAIEIHDANNNGKMDNDDYILFFAQGPDCWQFDITKQIWFRDHHPYATLNFCYLRVDAPQHLLIATQENGNSQVNGEINTYTALAFHETDLVNVTEGGLLWMGEKMTPANNSLDISLAMPSRSDNRIVVRSALASVTNASSHFSIHCGSSNKQYYYSSDSHYEVHLDTFVVSAGGNLSFSISYSPSEASSQGYLDFLEVNATSPLSFSDGQMCFRNNQTTDPGNRYRFQISNAPTGLRVWNISNYNTTKEMPLSRNGSTAEFIGPATPENEYIAFDGSAFLYPATIEQLDCQDIHGSGSPDLVIVANKALLSQGQQIASLHTLYDGLECLTVSEEEVFNEFSSGKRDPIAIREMLRMMRQRVSDNQGPKYLLLLGKGSYDSKNILGSDLLTVVTGISQHSFEDRNSTFASDDIFGYLDDTEAGFIDDVTDMRESLDIGIGRIPARSTDEADLVVNKIAEYLNRSDLGINDIRGDWRNYVALLADDADPSSAADVQFVTSSEYTAQQILDRYPQFILDKIYADSYHQQSGAIGSYYPDANNALKQRMDYGCILLNYVGHGSVEYIGTEQYMTKSDINGYTNFHQLPYFVTSTCSFGRYDKVSTMCGAESFLLAPAAGIAVLSASRPIQHQKKFNTDVCMLSLDPENSIGDALRMAKNNSSVPYCITLFGDPALHLSLPQKKVVVTEVNGHNISENAADSIEVLSQVTISGEIQEADGSLCHDFSGSIYPIVFDRVTHSSTLANDNEGTEVPFSQQKSILYKGRDTVINGRFEYTFIVPRDVSYTYDYARLCHYAKSTNIDASGSYSNIMFGGFNEDVDLSETRPTIKLFMNDSSFRNGGITNSNPSIFAILEDSVGINSVGSGIGHDITALIDDNANEILTLNDFYETDMEDSHRGYVRYFLKDLEPGYHTVSLKAWNIYNYSNSASINFYVHPDHQKLYSFNASPNPATSETSIRIEHNQTVPITNAELTIYDIKGRPVKHLIPTISANNSVGPVIWDFRNDEGIALPNGIYIVRSVLVNSDGEKITLNGKIIKMGQ